MVEVDEATVRQDARQWWGLVVVGAWCAFATVPLIVVQLGLYVVWPPPDSSTEMFELLLDNPVLGLISLDLLFIVSNTLMYLIYLALAVVLWRVSRSAVVIALGFCVVGIATYLSTPPPVEMLTLAHAYDGADAATRIALVATGDGLLARLAGTGYDVYYFFTLVTLALLTLLMLRSTVFSRGTAGWGLVSAALMTVPANFGTVGMVLAVASLLPFSVFAILVGRRLLQLAGTPTTVLVGFADRPREPKV